MTPDQEPPGREQEQTAEAVAEPYRSEKIRFRWTCIFAGLALLTWVLARAGSWFVFRELRALLAASPSPDSDAVRNLMHFWRLWVFGFGIAMLAFLVAFLISFIAWLIAIRKRRKALGAEFLSR